MSEDSKDTVKTYCAKGHAVSEEALNLGVEGMTYLNANDRDEVQHTVDAMMKARGLGGMDTHPYEIFEVPKFRTIAIDRGNQA